MRRCSCVLAALTMACAPITVRKDEAPQAEAEPRPEPGGHVEPELVGVVHVVKRGETLYRIARTYGVSQKEVMEVNGLQDVRQLAVGTELFIPGATRSPDAPELPGTEDTAPGDDDGAAPRQGVSLRWPLRGVLYSRFGIRQGERHDGIDIAAPDGTNVGAAAAGTVVFSGRQRGYGELVIVRHPGSDLLTVYAHASAILVRTGDEVAAGQPIARVGRTGRTTGPHLHFEVREGTRPRDPLKYLP